MNTYRFLCLWIASLIYSTTTIGGDYSPVPTQNVSAIKYTDTVVTDTKRDRDIPIRIYTPASFKDSNSTDPTPIVLFSHGLGGSRSGSTYLGNQWAAKGYVAVFLQHPGSDEEVWKNERLGNRINSLKDAASGKNLLNRTQDVSIVIDQLELWNADSSHFLHDRLNTKKIGMSGHSFGGQTTQAVCGQTFPLIGQRWTDKRISAAIIMSPSSPERGSVDQAFQSVSIPWLLMTGTRDTAAIGGQTPESRRKVYPALPKGDKYELVLYGAEHSAFSDRPLQGKTDNRNANHHQAILALSIAFWDAYLKENKDAKNWLEGDGPRKLLETSDVWQNK